MVNPSLLAIQGGAAAFANGPPDWPVADDAVYDSVQSALKSGQWGKYESELTDQLHIGLQSQFDLRNSLLCSSGTIGVELALRAIGVKPQNEVILAAYDFPGNFRAIEAIGAVPVLIDVVADGWVIDPSQIAAAISEKTTAIVVSHLHGQMANMPAIIAIAADANIKVVEDVCQSPGATIGQQSIGTFGDVATFSFGGSKLLSAGRGGAILSDDDAVIQRAKIFAQRGNDAFPLSQIQAALLLPQLEKLEMRNEIRHRRATQISQAVNALEGLGSLKISAPGDEHDADTRHCKQTFDVGSYYKVPILIDESFGIKREMFLAAIQPEGVAIDVGFRGFFKRSGRRCRWVGELPNSRRAARDTMVLHHPILLAEDDQIDRLIDAIERCHQFCWQRR